VRPAQNRVSRVLGNHTPRAPLAPASRPPRSRTARLPKAPPRPWRNGRFEQHLRGHAVEKASPSQDKVYPHHPSVTATPSPDDARRGRTPRRRRRRRPPTPPARRRSTPPARSPRRPRQRRRSRLPTPAGRFTRGFARARGPREEAHRHPHTPEAALRRGLYARSGLSTGILRA
jgi:hypothetical protein